MNDNPMDNFDNLLLSTINPYMDGLENNLKEACIYALSGGGKHIRPKLMFLSNELIDKNNVKHLIPLAVGLECIHNYSLIHDDMPCMDNDDFRRGRPTIHKKYGEAVALLAGDALLNLGMEIMIESIIDYPQNAVAVSYIACKSGIKGMIGGQAIDIKNDIQTKDEMLKTYLGKTSALIEASMVSPFLASYQDKVYTSIIEQIANKTGLIYQLRDDTFDFIDGTDKNKPTYVSMFGTQKTEEYIVELNNEINSLFDKLNNKYNISKLKDFVFKLANRTK